MKGDHFLVINVGGVGYKVFGTKRFLEEAVIGYPASIFTHYHLRENAAELYGFPSKEELGLFELLTSVSGVGPKSGLSILETAAPKDIVAAITEGRPDLLTQASGVGRKTAERLIIELRGKVHGLASEETVKRMEKDADLEDALMGLGYKKGEVKTAISKIEKGSSLEEHLKEALRILNRK